MMIRSIYLESTAFHQRQLPRDRFPKVLFIGRSNVGKSSMINCLLQRKHLARTSSRPGKTMSINYFLINDAFHFVDLPGYGYARASGDERARVRRLLAAFIQNATDVRLVCLLIDARRVLLHSDLEIVELLVKKKYPILTILTKSDKISSSSLKNQITEFQKTLGIHVIPFSTKSGMGRTEIWEQIKEALKER